MESGSGIAGYGFDGIDFEHSAPQEVTIRKGRRITVDSDRLHCVRMAHDRNLERVVCYNATTGKMLFDVDLSNISPLLSIVIFFFMGAKQPWPSILTCGESQTVSQPKFPARFLARAILRAPLCNHGCSGRSMW